MKQTIIHNLPNWRVTSYGNGLAYEILNKRAAKSIYFQGDDADQYRDQFQALTEMRSGPQFDFADALQIIWNDYSDIATDMEGQENAN